VAEMSPRRISGYSGLLRGRVPSNNRIKPICNVQEVSHHVVAHASCPDKPCSVRQAEEPSARVSAWDRFTQKVTAWFKRKTGSNEVEQDSDQAVASSRAVHDTAESSAPSNYTSPTISSTSTTSTAFQSYSSPSTSTFLYTSEQLLQPSCTNSGMEVSCSSVQGEEYSLQERMARHTGSFRADPRRISESSMQASLSPSPSFVKRSGASQSCSPGQQTSSDGRLAGYRGKVGARLLNTRSVALLLKQGSLQRNQGPQQSGSSISAPELSHARANVMECRSPSLRLASNASPTKHTPSCYSPAAADHPCSSDDAPSETQAMKGAAGRPPRGKGARRTSVDLGMLSRSAQPEAQAPAHGSVSADQCVVSLPNAISQALGAVPLPRRRRSSVGEVPTCVPGKRRLGDDSLSVSLPPLSPHPASPQSLVPRPCYAGSDSGRCNEAAGRQLLHTSRGPSPQASRLARCSQQSNQ